jgi:hypothetical protein
MSGAARRHGTAKQKHRRRRRPSWPVSACGHSVGAVRFVGYLVGHGEFGGEEEDRSARRSPSSLLGKALLGKAPAAFFLKWLRLRFFYWSVF